MRDALVHLLATNPLLLLFLVAAIGYPLGRLKVRGSELGVAAVLFVGLAAGGLDPSLALPEIVYMLGLALFVYTVGLSAGRGFLASLGRGALRHNALALAAVALAGMLSALLAGALGLDAPHAAGLFAGAATSTPSLAAAVDALKQTRPAPEALAAPVVAYSLAYPFGVLGVVIAIRVSLRLFRVDLAAEAPRLAALGAANEPLSSATVRVTNDMGPLTIEELVRGLGWRVIFGRLKRGDQLQLAAPGGSLRPGDLVTVVGTAAEIDRVVERLGQRSADRIDLDRSAFDLRRIFVSNQAVAGVPLRHLDLPRRHGAVITRVRRGDVDLLPSDDLRLEIGDRVRVLAPADRLPELTAYFGDSYRAASEVDILTFGLGLALGLALGVVPFTLPGGLRFTLGFAGGPLVVALVLGAAGRTGGLAWNLPFSANVTLRQLGLILFLAGIGTRAGAPFFHTVATRIGAEIVLAGAAVTFATAMAVLAVGYRFLRVPMTLLVGTVAGVFTQTALLGYALETTRSEAPSLSYAEVYAVSMIGKIVFVQLMLGFG